MLFSQKFTISLTWPCGIVASIEACHPGDLGSNPIETFDFFLNFVAIFHLPSKASYLGTWFYREIPVETHIKFSFFDCKVKVDSVSCQHILLPTWVTNYCKIYAFRRKLYMHSHVWDDWCFNYEIPMFTSVNRNFPWETPYFRDGSLYSAISSIGLISCSCYKSWWHKILS